MAENFDIKPGKYDVPEVGKVVSVDHISDETALKLYKLSRRVFPWIYLNENSLSFLKEQKFNAPEVAQLIQNARTTEEALTLAELSDTKTVSRILDTKIKALQNN